MNTPTASDAFWFYSSLAQVSAAIVGLMGAVLGTRLIGHVEEMRAARERVLKLMTGTQDMLRERQTRREFERWSEDRSLREQIHRLYEQFQGRIDEAAVRKRVADMRAVAMAIPGSADQQAKSNLQHEANMLEDFASALQTFRSSLVPRTFAFILGLLGFIAFTGIVWPLAALPGLPFPFTSSWMLSALTLALLALVSYFIYEFRQLRELDRIDWQEGQRRK